jgi:hypothetical protein
MYVPALSFETLAVPFFSVIVKPGPTTPVKVGVAASALGTTRAAASATIATSFI